MNPKEIRSPRAGLFERWTLNLYRIVILVAVFAVFFPGLNPGRVSETINRNLSLFTESVSYSALVANVQRVLMRGWIDNSIFILLQIFSAIVLVGIVLCAIGAAMSFGNHRMRFFGQFFPLSGSILMLGGLSGLYAGYLRLMALGNDKVPAMLPKGFWFFAIWTGILLKIGRAHV